MTLPFHIVDAVNERLDRAAEEAVGDLIESVGKYPDRSFASVAEVAELLRDLAG